MVCSTFSNCESNRIASRSEDFGPRGPLWESATLLSNVEANAIGRDQPLTSLSWDEAAKDFHRTYIPTFYQFRSIADESEPVPSLRVGELHVKHTHLLWDQNTAVVLRHPMEVMYSFANMLYLHKWAVRYKKKHRDLSTDPEYLSKKRSPLPTADTWPSNALNQVLQKGLAACDYVEHVLQGLRSGKGFKHDGSVLAYLYRPMGSPTHPGHKAVLSQLLAWFDPIHAIVSPKGAPEESERWTKIISEEFVKVAPLLNHGAHNSLAYQQADMAADALTGKSGLNGTTSCSALLWAGPKIADTMQKKFVNRCPLTMALFPFPFNCSG